MKQTFAIQLRLLTTMCLLFICQAVVWAQEETSSSTSSTSVTVTKEQTTDWMASPWVWVIGAAVFILLLVALIGRGGSDRRTTDRVTVTKEVRTDREADI